MLSNTLMIGRPIVAGRVVGRTYNIDFTCKFNNVATASSSINAVNTMSNEVTFDLESAQPTDLSFAFDLAFYESNAFVTAADLINGAVQPGSPLFGQVAPAASLPAAFEFSVTKCTVEDREISGAVEDRSLDILDVCPAQATSFGFESAQSGTTSVQFTFDSFTFPASSDSAILDVTCEVNVCPENSAECLNLCDIGDDSSSSSSSSSSFDSSSSSSSSSGPKDHLLYLGQSTSKGFVMNSDGTTRAAEIILPPGLTSSDWQSSSHYYAYYYDDDTPVGANYLFQSKSAIIKGQVYFFGGVNDAQSGDFKIVTLNGCELVNHDEKLTRRFDASSSVMSINGGSEALICFSFYTPFESCNTFDGTSAADTYASNVSHNNAGLAYYKGKPTSVSSSYRTGYKKIETLGENGWEYLEDFPINLSGHSLVGLASGDLLIIGGHQQPDGDTNYDFSSEIWRKSAIDGSVTKAGDLKRHTHNGSVLAMNNYIYVVDRYYGRETNAVQRIQLNEEEDIERTEIVTEFDQGGAYLHLPILVAVEADFCQA